jgi:branched-chain amino acid aminotransferase
MAFKFFSYNGEILPADQAVVPLNSVEYSYGFGVYETIRVNKGEALFLKEHCQRLMESAKIINLEHGFTFESVSKAVNDLVEKNQADTCNIKILLIGGQAPDLYILSLNPLFPDRKLYKQGAHTITQHYERPFPHAKTLNMLPSYLAYREAKKAGAYDALAVNRDGNITEGTRTNFFALKGKTIYSPPEKDILLGVTRDNVLKVARQNRFKIAEKDFPLKDIAQYEGVFLTSTSSKLMPVTSVDDHTWPQIAPAIKELMAAFDSFLSGQQA